MDLSRYSTAADLKDASIVHRFEGLRRVPAIMGLSRKWEKATFEVAEVGNTHVLYVLTGPEQDHVAISIDLSDNVLISDVYDESFGSLADVTSERHFFFRLARREKEEERLIITDKRDTFKRSKSSQEFENSVLGVLSSRKVNDKEKVTTLLKVGGFESGPVVEFSKALVPLITGLTLTKS